MAEQGTTLAAEDKWHKYKIIKKTSGNNYYQSFQAIHFDLQRPCYLKIVNDPTPQQLEHFKRKAREMAIAGEHPHVEKIYDLGKGEFPHIDVHEGAYYAELEWTDIGYFMNFDEKPKRIEDWPYFLNFMSKIAKTLHDLHNKQKDYRKRIFHGNIMWRYLFVREDDNPIDKKDPFPLICGFGLAERLEDNPELAKYGLSKGGVGYLSPYRVKWISEGLTDTPECMSGDKKDPIKEEDLIKHEIWSFGATMYHMITGSRILDRKGDEGELSYETARERVLADDYLDLAKLKEKIPKELQKDVISIVTECMRKNINTDTTTMKDMATRLAHAAIDTTEHTLPLLFWPPYTKPWLDNNNVTDGNPCHDLEDNNKPLNDKFKDYLDSICPCNEFPQHWDKHFYKGMNSFLGKTSLLQCETNADGKAIGEPHTLSFGTIVFLLTTSINNKETFNSIDGLQKIPWETLNNYKIIEEDITQNDAREALVLIRLLFEDLSHVKGDDPGKHCIKWVDYSELNEGRLTIHLLPQVILAFSGEQTKRNSKDRFKIKHKIDHINDYLDNELIVVDGNKLIFQANTPCLG